MSSPAFVAKSRPPFRYTAPLIIRFPGSWHLQSAAQGGHLITVPDPRATNVHGSSNLEENRDNKPIANH